MGKFESALGLEEGSTQSTIENIMESTLQKKY